MKQMALVAAESQGWPILEPVEVADLPRPVALNKDVCVVGTRPEVNLKLSSPLVSRTHAMFVADHDLIYLRDLASRNHTYLNDKPIREAVLRDGDVITLGKLTFRCKSGFDRPYDPTEMHVPTAELRAAKDGKRIALNTRSTLIGSRDDCDVVLSGKDIEPSHAVIFQREGQWHIRDLRTVSGTWVNDAAVGQMELHPGDQIRIGNARFVYQLAAAEEKTQKAPKPTLPAKPATAARHPLDGEADDEQVELELADDTAGIAPELVGAVPESVGLSDFDAADVRSEPLQGSAVDEDELTPHDSSAHGVSFAGPVPVMSPAAADGNVIPISLEELDEPAVASPSSDDVPAAAGSAFDIATEEVPSPSPITPEASDEISLQSVLDEPMDLAPAEAVALEAVRVGDSNPHPAPSDDAEQAAHDEAEGALVSTTEPVAHDLQPEDVAVSDRPLPAHQNGADPEEKLTELLGHLAEDIAEVRSTWEEVRTKHADEPHPVHPGVSGERHSGQNGQPADDPDAEPSRTTPGSRSGMGFPSQL